MFCDVLSRNGEERIDRGQGGGVWGLVTGNRARGRHRDPPLAKAKGLAVAKPKLLLSPPQGWRVSARRFAPCLISNIGDFKEPGPLARKADRPSELMRGPCGGVPAQRELP